MITLILTYLYCNCYYCLFVCFVCQQTHDPKSHLEGPKRSEECLHISQGENKYTLRRGSNKSLFLEFYIFSLCLSTLSVCLSLFDHLVNISISINYELHCPLQPATFPVWHKTTRSPNPPQHEGRLPGLCSTLSLLGDKPYPVSITDVVYNFAIRAKNLVVSCAGFIYLFLFTSKMVSFFTDCFYL